MKASHSTTALRPPQAEGQVLPLELPQGHQRRWRNVFALIYFPRYLRNRGGIRRGPSRIISRKMWQNKHLGLKTPAFGGGQAGWERWGASQGSRGNTVEWGGGGGRWHSSGVLMWARCQGPDLVTGLPLPCSCCTWHQSWWEVHDVSLSARPARTGPALRGKAGRMAQKRGSPPGVTAAARCTG